ncbi:MAG: phosphatase PAP2 family protein [Chloroflexi bacterium]|nr:phosphatase PAP2 family protein [Chloroflexota bacterium]
MTDPRSHAPGTLAIGIFIVYVLVLAVVMVTQGVEPLPDRFAVAMLLGAVILGRGKRFIADWSPFVFLVVSYDFLRGLAPALSGRAHFLTSIHVDQALFGVVPTVALQRLLYTGSPQWWDYAATVVYFLHFVVPLGFAMLLWLRDRRWFAEFVASITLLSYAAWITYVLFPAAPPWMAAQAGHLDGVTRILDKTINVLPDRLDLPSVYRSLDPNPVAAIPSIHAAYPFLVLLFAVRYVGRRGLLVALYVAAVWWAIVYLGEHYATDILVGVVYSIAAFLAGPAAVRALSRLRIPRMLGGSGRPDIPDRPRVRSMT